MAESSMIKKIAAADFHPEKYVKELSQRCVGGQELQQQRQKIQSLADDTNGLLKRNVYQNYMQFIETAKEISHLESEMYQLSHMLTEQRSLLDALSSTSLTGDRMPSLSEAEQAEPKPEPVDEKGEEEERRRKLAAILEKVEGCTGLLEVSGRTMLHDGDMLELDPVDNTAMQRVHAYLLSDGLMIAAWISNRSGPVRYKYQAFYQLASLALVNVRNEDNLSTAVKLLAFPATRLFQCVNPAAKQEWLEKCYQAKKSRLSMEQQKREATASVSSLDKSPTKQRTESVDSYNPFEESIDSEPEHPEWLVEVPEDLDVCIAQRHFEDAFNLLERARQYLDKATPTDPTVLDIRRKVDARVKSLTEVLMKELEVHPDKSLQGGLRAARRAVRLLNQLERSTQACELFLKLCSSILKTQLKRVKREGNTVLYVRQVGGIFFSNLMDMGREFLRAFPNSPSCASAFVVWSGSELTHVTSHLVKQVFMPQSSTATLAECVATVREQCDQLCELGVDLRYLLDGLLRTPLTRALKECREKLVDAVKLRSAEDRWRPLSLNTRAGLARFHQEMADLGVAGTQAYVTGDCWVELTGNTVAFTKLYLPLLDDCVRLATPELTFTVDEVLADVFRAQLRHTELSLHSDRLRAENQVIEKNALFLFDTLLPLAEKVYQQKMGFPCTRLCKLKEEFQGLRGELGRSKKVTKYSTTEYI